MKKIALSLLLSLALSTSTIGSDSTDSEKPSAAEAATSGDAPPSLDRKSGGDDGRRRHGGGDGWHGKGDGMRSGGFGNWQTAEGSLGRLKDTLEALTTTCNTLSAKVTEAGLSDDLRDRAKAELDVLETLKSSLESERSELERIAAATPDQKVGMRNYRLLNAAAASASKIIEDLIRINSGAAKKTLEERAAAVSGKVEEAKATLNKLKDPEASKQTSLDFTASDLDRLLVALNKAKGNKDLQRAYLESIEIILRGVENSAEFRSHHERRRKAAAERDSRDSEGSKATGSATPPGAPHYVF